MEKIKEISKLKFEISSEFGDNNSNKDLVEIMLKVINEKAEYFNRNNLFNISENISDLGLEKDPDNIDLLTEKSISNSERGNSYIIKAIDINNKILEKEPNNLSAKLNKITNIAKLCLKEQKSHIKDLIYIINKTNIINENSKIIVGKAIEVLTDIITKYDKQIYYLFQDKEGESIFPKAKLLYFSFYVIELQYKSSELLKIYYSTFEGKDLIIDTYNYEKLDFLGDFDIFNILYISYRNNNSEFIIKKEDENILEIMEKIILNDNIVVEVKINILFLYSKFDPYFIIHKKCYKIPLDYIEFIIKYKYDCTDYIYTSLKVLLTFIKIINIILSESLKKYLFKYIEKNVKNNNLMINETDIEEYFRKNKYDESKLEFTFESIKENFKKKYYEELINKVYSQNEINVQLLQYLKENGINLELIINRNKNKIKDNIEFILNVFIEYIKYNVNKITTNDLKGMNSLLEINCDVYIKDNLIKLISEISKNNKYKNKIPMRLLINISKEIIKVINSSSIEDNSTSFFNKVNDILTSEKRIDILIGIMYNFLACKEKRQNLSSKIDNSIFNNLCYLILNLKLNENNKNKIIKIFKINEKEIPYDIKNIFEMVYKTQKLEENIPNEIKNLLIHELEEKIKEGFELNINTTTSLNKVINENLNNNKIMNQSISLINTNVINNKKIDVQLSEKLINIFIDENIKLDKQVFDNLIICLMNIIKNCELDEHLSNKFYNNLTHFSEKKILNKPEFLIISLKILTQKHYSFNKKPILNCLHLLAKEKINKSNSLFDDFEDIILNSFKEQNLEEEIFNALFNLLDNNIYLFDSISLCLLKSLKNKKQNEIDNLVKHNMKKFENFIVNNSINLNLIEILIKAKFEIFADFEIVKNFVFFTIKLKKENSIPLIDFINFQNVRVVEYHIKLIEDRLNIEGYFQLLTTIIDNNEFNLINKIDANKIISNLYYDFNNGINLLYKIIGLKSILNDNSLILLSNYLYNNHNEDKYNGLHLKISNIFSLISNYQNIPKEIINKLSIENFSFKGKQLDDELILLEDILSRNNIPKRYYEKIINILDNKNIDHGIKMKSVTRIFLNSLEKGEIIPNELYKKFFSLISRFEELDELKYILINKNSSEKLKKLFYEKFHELLLKTSRIKDEQINFLIKLIIIIDFKDISFEDLKKEIFNLLINYNINENSLFKIIYWIIKNTLDINYRKLLIKILEKNDIIKNFENLDENNDNFENKIKVYLYNVILDKEILKLNEKLEENFDLVKSTIIQYSSLDIEQDSNGIIIRYIQFLNNIILVYNLDKKRIFDYIEFSSVIKDLKVLNITNDKKYLDYLKEEWILSKIKKTKNYSHNISLLFTKRLIKNNFGNNIIKTFIKIVNIDSEKNLNNFFDFYEKNKINENLFANILFNDLNKIISLNEIKQKLIINLIDLYKGTNNITKNFAKIICEVNNWEIEDIYKFLDFGNKHFNKLNDLQIEILEDCFKETKFAFNKKNNKDESLFDIFEKYEDNFWEYKIKQLGLPNKSENERSLDEIFSELLKNNTSINNALLKTTGELKQIYYNIEKKFYMEGEGDNKPIEKWNSEDILKWSKSTTTKKNINEDFFITELLAVIKQANYLSDGHYPRKVQMIAVLLFLFSPKNKGLFTQIKTGEGKTTIVAILATINALRGKYVDVLTSSEILAERDSKEKQKFYSMFNLSVTHAKNDHFHKYNIVYGDTLSFEGDLLRKLFREDPNKSNFQRGHQCIIIDEVDSTCIDNLSSATQLVSGFGGYGALNGLYPIIYQNLNMIDQFILEGRYPDITKDNIREKTIEKLKETTENIFEEGIKNKIFTFPKHIEEFARNQIDKWCESAYNAKNVYQPNIHYVISGNDGSKKIAPVDYQNTGVIHLNMHWGNGLHQFLQLKHGVKLENESLNTTFLSHYNFIRKYITPRENNVYGLTGTLGSNSTRGLLKKLFGVNVIIIPTFKKSNYINLYPKLLPTEEEWKKAIIENILNPINKKRVTLVICKTITKVNILIEELKSKNYPEDKIERYDRNDEDFKFKERYGPGFVILATNLAGRGTDIKLTDEVEKNGGMHVILSFLPDNQRVEEQALGRTARSGKNGSGIIIMEKDLDELIIKNKDGKKIMNNKIFQIISLIRENNEKDKMNDIEKNKINSLKLKSEIFDKFTKLFIELKKYLKSNNYDEEKIRGIANDVEEKWGLWMNKNGLDEEIDYNKKDEIEKSYDEFEKRIKQDYFTSSSINLLNPFNYFSFSDYSSAKSSDNNSCFFASYLEEIKNIKEKEEIKEDSDKQNLRDAIKETNTKLQENLQTSLEGMLSTISNINNNFEEREDIKPCEDCKNDIKEKLEIIGKISQGLMENIKIVENSIGNDKHSITIKNKVCISDLTSKEDLRYFFNELKIGPFYELDIEVKKDWLGIFCTIFIGALEIAAGCILMCYTGGRFGSEFIEEGFDDIKYGIECLAGKKEFSWSDFKKKKLNFLIKTAVSLAMKLLTAGFSDMFCSKSKLGFKTVFKQVAKKIVKKAAIEVGKEVAAHLIGPEIMEKIISKVKSVLKDGVVKYFGNKLKSLIPNEIRSMMCINIVIYKGKNPIQRLLVDQLKNSVHVLGDILNLIIDLLLNLLKAITSNSNPVQVINSIFEKTKNNALEILKSGLIKSLTSLASGSISELKKIISGKTGGKYSDTITSWSDYFIKGAKVCKTIAEAEQLASVLVKNGVLSLNGELNTEQIFEKDKGNNGQKIKLNLNITKSIGNIAGFAQSKIDSVIYNITDKIKMVVKQELESLFFFIISDYSNGIEFLRKSLEEVKNLIKNNINIFKDEIIQNSNRTLNNLKNQIFDSSKELKANLKTDFKNIKNTLNNLHNNINKKLLEFAQRFINDKFGSINIIQTINKKIDINKIINNIQNFSNKLNDISNDAINEYIPILETINIFIESNTLDKLIKKAKNLINEIILKLNNKIQLVINFIKSSNDELNKISPKNLSLINIKTSTPKEINDSIDYFENDLINIDENVENEMITKIEDIQNYLLDLDDKIDLRIDQTLNKLFDPFELLIKKISEIPEKIQDKIEIEISRFISSQLNMVNKELISFINSKIKNVGNENINIESDNNNKFYENPNGILDKVISKPMDLVNKFQSFYQEMDNYEKRSNEDETINILNDIIIDKLIDILMKAIASSEIGKIIADSSKKILKEMEATKKNLRHELEDIAAVPSKEYQTKLRNNFEEKFNKKVPIASKIIFSKVSKELKNVVSACQESIIKHFKNNFKYPEGFKVLLYINSKFGDNPIKKLLAHQLNISLNSLRDLGNIIDNLIEKINSISNLDSNALDSVISLISEFSGKTLLKADSFLSKTLTNLKNCLFSLLSELILGKSKNKYDLILSWSDYLIKGAKVCSKVSEAESLTNLLVKNGIISINGELNKENILDMNDLKSIEIKNFPIKLKLNFKENYNKIKSKIDNTLTKIDPEEKIISITVELENKIKLIINKGVESINQNCSFLIKSAVVMISKLENECKNKIKENLDIFIKNFGKDLINISNKIKNIIKNESNNISGDLIILLNSIEDKIFNIEKNINDLLVNNLLANIQSSFGDNTLIKKLEENLNLNNIINIINNLPEIIMAKINILSEEISKNVVIKILPDINNKILNIFKSFKIRYQNDIRPALDFINKIKINFDEIKENEFLKEKKMIPINTFPIMKEMKKQLNNIKSNVNIKKEEILDYTDYLIGFVYNFYDSIFEIENHYLDALFKPCDDFMANFLKINEEIEKNINNIIFPMVSSIIKDYLDIIRNYCSNKIKKIKNYGNKLVEKTDNKINTLNNEVIKYEQKAVNAVEKKYGNVRKCFEKINFDKAGTLMEEFTNLCRDIKDYDEIEVSDEIISELCYTIKNEIKKIIRNSMEKLKENRFLKFDFNSLIKEIGLK